MASIAEQNTLTTTLKSWPERIKTFYNDVRTEMKKVTAPSLKEVQSTTAVVISPFSCSQPISGWSTL